jgi:hypothetical protein
MPGTRRGSARSSSAGLIGWELMARFINAQVPEVARPFWAALQ